MIYRFQILAESGSYEGWAHSEEEMKSKARAQLPGEDLEVFLTEGPQILSLRAYRIVESTLGKKGALVLDHLLAEGLLDSVLLDDMPEKV